MDMRKVTVDELHAEMKAQGVSSREHIAFRCVVCGTVQSLASFARHTELKGEEVERYLGFSCIGRFTNAGPWVPPPRSKRAARQAREYERRRQTPGCDWTLGGLFQVHRMVVVTPDGKEHPSFELANSEEAQALMVRDGKVEPGR